MAEKRMFSKSIVLSDAFLDMPMSARCLYFTLSMMADDDGFIGNPKAIMRQCGASQDDMSILLQKRYVLGFESGVIVIKHWRINNYLRNDRTHPTTYIEEKDTLTLDEKGAYTEKNKVGIPTDNQLTTNCQASGIPSIDKNRLEENSIDLTIINDSLSDSKSDPKQKIIEMWNELSVYGIPPVKRISEGSKRMTCLRSRMKQFALDDFAEAIEQIKQSSFLQGKNKQGWMITFDWFILPSNFSKVLEGNYNDKKGARNSGNVKAGLEQYSSGNAERDREMDEINRRIESGEADADDDGLWD